MSEQRQRMCVLLPCGEQRWAIPQNCLAEIVTLPAHGDSCPGEISWRGVDIPVMDFGEGGALPWRDDHNNTGLVAVMLGVKGAGFDYWGVALRGDGLSVRQIEAEQCEDRPEALQKHALAAFELDGLTYQVPDLPALQSLAVEMDTAVTA